MMGTILNEQIFLKSQPPILTKKKIAKLFADGETYDLADAQQQMLINVVAVVCKIETKEAVIISIRNGGIKFIIEVPENASYKLQSLSSEDRISFINAGIKAIQLDEPEIIELSNDGQSMREVSLKEEARTINLFISYSYQNQDLFNQLNKHLLSLKRKELVSSWYTHCMRLEEDHNQEDDWDQEIVRCINSSQIIVLLLSPDLIASKQYSRIELLCSSKVKKGESIVIPILIEPVDYRGLDIYIEEFLLPESKKPVVLWGNRDEAFLLIQQKIEELIKNRKRYLQVIADTSVGLGKDINRPTAMQTMHENNQTIKKIETMEKCQYSATEKYIPRRVLPVKDGNTNYFIDRKLSQGIKDIIENQTRIVLIADGGVGKTTELNNIAAYYSKQDTLFYPFLIKLNTYVNEEVSSLLSSISPNWIKITEESEKQILVILDGLDEIEGKNFNDAVKRIEAFSYKYPEIHIIISCRTNFYRFQSKTIPSTLKNYSCYLLLELDSDQIQDYITEELGINSSGFNSSISNKQLNSLLTIPFYLTNLISLYSESSSLPRTKAEIFEGLLNLRFVEDAKRTVASVDNLTWQDNQNLISPTLERIALGMEILGRNYITNEEFQTFVVDSSLRKLLRYCSVWKKPATVEDNDFWEFEHRHFQEYLAAKMLAQKSVEDIKKVISLDESKDIDSSWTNTLSFLISIMDEETSKFNELLDWVKGIDSTLIVNFEPDKINEQIRFEYIKGMLETYKEVLMASDYSTDYYSNLAHFGQSDKLIDYLLEVIKETKDTKYINLSSNCLGILRCLNIPSTKKNIVTSTLIDCVINSPLGGYVKYRAITALTDLKLHSQKVIDQIISNCDSSEDTSLREGLYYLLYNSDYLEDNIEVFLKGLKFGSYDDHEYSRTLSIGLSKVETPEVISKVIMYFTNNLDLLRRQYLTYNGLINNAIKAYYKNKDILSSILGFVYRAVINYGDELAEHFINFFDKTNTRFDVFKSTLDGVNDGNYHYSLRMLVLLANVECVDFFLNKYKETPFSDGQTWFFYNSLARSNQELFEYFDKEINQISGNKFVTKSAKQIAEEKEDELRKDVELLFDKEAFTSGLEEIFTNLGKSELTEEEIVEIQIGERSNHNYSKLLLGILRNLTSIDEEEDPKPINLRKAKKISIKEIQEFKWNWDWLRISKLYGFFQKHKNLSLSDSQKQWVTDFCNSNLRKIDFKTALVNKNPDQTNTSYQAVYLWYFLRKLNLSYPKDVLLDLLSFDWAESTPEDRYSPKYIGIDYLEEKLSLGEMKERVLLNLQIGIRNREVINNHLNFCTKHAIKEAVPHIIHMINPIYPIDYNINNHSSWYHTISWIRESALKTVYELCKDEDISLLELVLPHLVDDFKWNIVELILEKSNACKIYLLKLLQNSQEKKEKFQAASYLILLEEIEALEYYVSYFEEDNEPIYFRAKSYEHPIQSLRNSETISFIEKSIPLLIRLLGISYKPKYLNSGFSALPALNQIILNSLEVSALKFNSLYEKIKESLEAFINNCLEDNIQKDLTNFVKHLEKQYKLRKKRLLSVKDVIKILDSLK